MDDMPKANTDKELWREPTTDFGSEDGNNRGMEPSVFVTADGKVGFNHYGSCVMRTIEEWVDLAWPKITLPNGNQVRAVPRGIIEPSETRSPTSTDAILPTNNTQEENSQ